MHANAEPGEPARPPWRTVNLVLLVLAVVLAAATVAFTVRGAAADPGTQRAEALSRQQAAVSTAARAETLAFLTLDYRDMGPRIDAVLAGATGSFKKQYAGARAELRRTTTAAQAVSTGVVRSVGVSKLSEENAVVLVAADSSVTNRSTKGKAQPRYYRLKLTMVKQGDRWLTSDLEFVG